MAQIQVQLHWDGKEVVKTYQVLSTEASDKIQFVTTDPNPPPFIIKSPDAALAESVGVQKEKAVDGLNDLYRVKTVSLEAAKAAPSVKNAPAPWRNLECGTIVGGHYKKWGGVDPDAGL